MNELPLIRSLALISVVIYLAVDYIDGKRVKDEREELIQLKSLELAHKASIGTLALLALLYCFFPWMDGLYIILVMILAALYTEIFGKLYYRNKL
jgi:hypothetical protein